MTKQQILDYLYSLKAGTYQVGNKDVVVTHYSQSKLTLAKLYHINDNGSYIEFKLVMLRDGVHMEDLLVKGDIKNISQFLSTVIPQPESHSKAIRRESLSIILLVYLVMGIICTPITIITFIYDQAWGWGLLCFTAIIFAWAFWVYRKLGELE